MTRRTIETTDYSYVVAPDVDLPVAQRAWAIVMTRLIDELTGDEPEGAVQLTCDNANFTARVGSGGFAGLAGIPTKAIPLHASKAYPLTLSVWANEYVADSRAVTILKDTAFPATFSPTDLGDWPMHRKPISIYGSVNLASPLGPQPINGATISLTSLWRRVSDPPAALQPLTLNGTLAAARPVGATVQAVSMTATGATYQLVKEAEPGSDSVLLSNTLGLAVGDVLGFDVTDPDLVEYATVVGISGSVTPAQPATVQLSLPLRFLHFSLGTVTQVVSAVIGAANALGVDAIAGDRVLLLNSPITAISTVDVVAISGGGPPTEYQVAAVFPVTSDPLGNYRLPLLSRVAQLQLTATFGALTPVPKVVIPAYGIPDYRVDFLMN